MTRNREFRFPIKRQVLVSGLSLGTVFPLPTHPFSRYYVASFLRGCRVTASNDSATFWPTAAILAASVLWGSSFAAMKMTIGIFGPWAVMLARMVVAFTVVLFFLRRLWPLPYRSGDWKFIVPFLLFQPCLYFTLEANALRFTSSSQAGLISASVPLMVALGAHLTLGEKVTRGTTIGLFVSLGGVVWLTLAGEVTEAASNPMLGNTLELGAMMTAVGYVLLVKHLSERYNPWALTAMQIIAGTLFFMPIGLVQLIERLPDITLLQALVLVYLGVGVTLGAFGLYNLGIKYIPANRASAYVNLIPVVAVLFGWVLLGETLNGAQIAAAFCVLAGVWMSQWGGKVELRELHDI
jgi:drug/metabolite transporter (DMT)-like permease